MWWHFPKVKGIYLPNTVLLFGKTQSEWKCVFWNTDCQRCQLGTFTVSGKDKTHSVRVWDSDKAKALERWHVIQGEAPLLGRTREPKSLPLLNLLTATSLVEALWTLCSNCPRVSLPLCSAPPFFPTVRLPSSMEILNIAFRGLPFACQIKLRLMGIAFKTLCHLDPAHISSLCPPTFLFVPCVSNKWAYFLRMPGAFPALIVFSHCCLLEFSTALQAKCSCHFLHEAFAVFSPPVSSPLLLTAKSAFIPFLHHNLLWLIHVLDSVTSKAGYLP